MVHVTDSLPVRLKKRFGAIIARCVEDVGEVTIEVDKQNLLSIATALRDESDFHFEQLIDVAGVDYSEYGGTPWAAARFAVVYHLLSLKHNQRLRMRVFADDEFPVVDSVVAIWPSANWYEREAFDLFGIVFSGHPDLRRILLDYGFIGHPFRKDFPLIGTVEMRYDPELRRVVYEPVSIEPRVLVPRVIRHDNRYVGSARKGARKLSG